MKEKVLLTVSGHAIDFLLGEFFSGVGGGLGCVGNGGGGRFLTCGGTPFLVLWPLWFENGS